MVCKRLRGTFSANYTYNCNQLSSIRGTITKLSHFERVIDIGLGPTEKYVQK